MRKLALLAAALAVTPATAQELATSYKSTEVAPGIYMLEGVGGFSSNASVLIGDDKVVLIDDTMVPTAPHLLKAVRDLSGRSVDFVVNTHVHGDHVGGNALLAEQDAIVVAHDNIRKRLLENPDDAGGPGGLPVVTYSDDITFHVNGNAARVFHVEHAHTDGDGAIHFTDGNVIHAGDIMFHKMFPFIDLDSGGDVDGYIAGQRQLLKMADEDTVIIPGHGDVATKADLQEDLDVLIECNRRVEEMVLKGMTVEEVVAANPLAEFHDVYNWGFITTERMTRTLYRDISGDL